MTQVEVVELNEFASLTRPAGDSRWHARADSQRSGCYAHRSVPAPADGRRERRKVRAGERPLSVACRGQRGPDGRCGAGGGVAGAQEALDEYYSILAKGHSAKIFSSRYGYRVEDVIDVALMEHNQRKGR